MLKYNQSGYRIPIEGIRMKLKHKITLIISILIIIIISILTFSMLDIWYESIQNQVAIDAMDQAIMVADNEQIKKNIIEKNGYIQVSQSIESIRLKTRIQYLYILNMDGIYYAHPIPSRINTSSIKDNLKVNLKLNNPSYYYELTDQAVVEGYAPIYTDGIQTGVVVVGIFNGRIIQTIQSYVYRLAIFALVIIAVGIGIAYILAKNIKKSIYGLEPEDIAILLHQKELILENIGEGILATDYAGVLLMINENAKQLLEIPTVNIGDSLTQYSFFELFKNLEDDCNETEWRITVNKILSIKIIKLQDMHSKLGFLCKIQDMSLVKKRAEELTNMKQLTQALRAQNHEFMNKLQTIYGLIQLENYEAAQEFIEQVTQNRQQIIKILQQHIKVPSLSGLLLAKYAKAMEQKIQIELTKDSIIKNLPSHAIEEDITSVVGNLIDNAIDALMDKQNGRILVTIREEVDCLIICICDNGPGVDQNLMDHIVEKGISTKGKDRGYGLYNVVQIIKQLKGDYRILSENGLVWFIEIPMDLKGGNQ